MRIPLDHNSTTPLYQQIQTFIGEQIQSGNLAPEMRLPASRALAMSLGVSRITVANAYAEMEAEGLVYTRPGSGTYVARQLQPLDEFLNGRPRTRDWPLWQQDLLTQTWQPIMQEFSRLLASVEHPDLIALSGGVGAEELFPVEEFGKTVREVIRRDGCVVMGYGDPAGYLPLRSTIAQILNSQGIPTHPDEVLVTSGSMQAIAMVAYLILRPGDVVLVESPTYSMTIDLFRSIGARVFGIPVDAQGMVVSELEAALQTVRPRLIYTIPTFHNPTGTCMIAQRRRQLIDLADRFNIPILEDDFSGDLRYEGRAQPALKALDPGGRVIYTSTFSKVLLPALRVGFLVASGPVFDRLLALKRTNDLTTSNFMQRALEAYITVGRYQSHLRRACRIYRQRRDAMLSALEKYMPSDISWEIPQGGLFLWVRLSEDCSADELIPLAGEEGMTFAPGSFFFPGQRVKNFMRLNFAMNSPERNVEAIRRLGRALDRLKTLKQKERPMVFKQKQVSL